MTRVSPPASQQNPSQAQMPKPSPENGWQDPAETSQMPSSSTQKDNDPLPPYTPRPQQRWQPQMQPQPQTPMLPDSAAIGAQYQASLYARCARGDHQVETSFGPCGIITCIFCFPIGLICLFADTHRRCSRCGISLDY